MCRLRLRTLMILVCLPLMASLRALGQYNPTQILNAWTIRQPGLTLAASHRGEVNGLYGNNMPENSIGGFQNAVDSGIEMVEMDVYTTQDHVPYLMHDKTLKRMLQLEQPSNYDPDRGTPAVYWAAIQGKILCGARGVTDPAAGGSQTCLSSSPAQAVPSLLDLTNAVRLSKNQQGLPWGGVLILDCRDKDGLVQAFSTLVQNGFLSQQVVFKFSPLNLELSSPQDLANLLSTSTYYNGNATQAAADMAAYMNMQPYYATNTAISQEQVTGDTSWAIHDWSMWVSNAGSFHRLLSAEVDVKGNPGEFMTSDQLYAAVSGSATLNTVGVYSTYFDCTNPNGPMNLPNLPPGAAGLNGYWTTDGKCVSLNPSTEESADSIDHRYDYTFISGKTSANIPNFGMILADTSGVLVNYLQGIGQRNLEPIQEHCSTGKAYPGCDDPNTPASTVYSFCAVENGICTFAGDRNVAFGGVGSDGNVHYTTKTFPNSAACNDDTFGDPNPGYVKSCYYGPPIGYAKPALYNSTPSNGMIYCADEGEYCSYNTIGPAAIAANGRYSYTLFNLTGYKCDVNQTFYYNGDPAVDFRKSCFYSIPEYYAFLHYGPAGYQFCAGERGTCQFKGPGRVAFGATSTFGNPMFNYGVFNGGVSCNNAVFKDPAIGYTKDCYYQVIAASSGETGTQVGTSSGVTGAGTGNTGPSQTFTVNAGATTFTVSQPNDSVATYTWTDGGAPSEWLTSASGSALSATLTSVPVSNWANAQPSGVITVSAGTTYQTIDGFGGAMTDSAAYLIGGSPNRGAIMQTLFGTDGAGLSIVRSPMGSSDLMADPNDIHTYEDTQGSFSVSRFASDNRQIDLLRQAKSIVGSNFKLLGTPWSAPGWAKRGGSLLPAQCGTDQDELNLSNVQRYAGYFANYVNAYTAVGLKPWMVSLQNEPENCKTMMPTTLLSSTDELALAGALKQQLPHDVKVLGWDHNWNDEFYVHALTSQSYGNIDAIGYHCYDGSHYGNQTQDLPTYFTECSGFVGNPTTVAQDLGTEVANNLIGPLRYGSRASLYWTLAQDPNGNPHLGSADACQNCRGMITVNGDGSFQPSQEFYYWSHLSRFVPPGSVRIDSNNAGNLSTVAFHYGNTTTLVVLNSTTHADGGSAGSDERDLRGHILQYAGDTSQQKTSWLVGADGYRRYINDISTFNCLKYDAGMQGPDVEPAGALDKYINLLDVWAVCGANTMGARSELEMGTYLKSSQGARLTLTGNGLTSVDSTGTSRWAPSGVGDRLILQEDQNLVLYSGTSVVWASNTVGSGAAFLSIRDDGTFALFNKQNKEVWLSSINTSDYRGKMVQWDGDTAATKTSWQVGYDSQRRFVHDLPTFQCLHDAGAGNSLNVSSDVLDQLPNLNNVWAACGTDRIGPNGSLELGDHLSAGNNSLILQSDGNLVLYHTTNGNSISTSIWSSGTSGSGAVQLVLQADGNLVLYTKSRASVWASGTDGSNPGYLTLGTDASLRLWDASGNNVWSRDPSEVPKYAQAGYNFCAKEGSNCNFVGTGRVFFGAPKQAVSTWKDNVNNTIACTVSAFGEDPDPGIAKDCWYRTPY